MESETTQKIYEVKGKKGIFVRWMDKGPDNYCIWHEFQDPETKIPFHTVDWTAYKEMSEEDIELYLELGCPNRGTLKLRGPLRREDLEKLKKRIEPNSKVSENQKPMDTNEENKIEEKINVNANQDPITGETGSHPTGSGLGAAAGATAGVMVGTVIAGPVGAMVGATIGGVVAGTAGAIAGHEIAEKVNPSVPNVASEEILENETDNKVKMPPL